MGYRLENYTTELFERNN